MSRTLLHGTILLASVSIILCHAVHAQNLSNTTWMRVYEADSTFAYSLTFGSHISATYGVDSALGEERRPAFAKGATAPGGLEVSFQPIPGRPDNSWYPGLLPKCLYETVPYSKKDTFVLSVFDADPRADTTTVYFEWADSATLAEGTDSMFLVDPTNQIPTPIVNMMTQSSLAIDNMFGYPITRMIIYRYTRPILTDGVRKTPPGIPTTFTLNQNYPNPFNPSTVIKYQIPIAGRVSVRIYNVLGQTVKTLVDEVQEAGYKSVEFDARNLPSGMYFYRLNAGTFSDMKKMLLIK